MGISGNQLLVSNYGLLKVKDLHQKPDLTLFTGEKAVRAPSIDIFPAKTKTYKLKLSRGLTLTATADQKILTDQGLVEVSDLRPLHKVVHQYNKGLFGPNNIPSEAKFLAENRIFSPTPFEVPSQIFRSNEVSQWAYIKGLYDKNAWSWSSMIQEGNGRSRPKIWVHLKVKNRKFLEQVQILLLNLGIVTTILIKRNQIGLYINSNYYSILLNKYTGILDRYNTFAKPLKVGYKGQRYCNILKVEDAGEQEVYKINLKCKDSAPQTFVCNGILIGAN